MSTQSHPSHLRPGLAPSRLRQIRAIAFGLLAALPISLFAAERVELDQTVDFAAGKVEIENVSGSVKVTGWDQPRVEIKGTLGRDVERLAVERDGDELSIRVVLPERGGLFSADASTLVIQVPTGVALLVETVSASIEIASLKGQAMSAESVSGNIRAEAGTGQARVASVSGDIDLLLAGAAVDVETVSGDVDVKGAEGKVNAATVSGRVRVAAGNLDTASLESVSGDLSLKLSGQARGSVQMESMSADVTLELGETRSYDLRIDTFSGGIRSSVGKVIEEEFGSGKRLRHREGESGPKIRIESFSGDVSVR